MNQEFGGDNGKRRKNFYMYLILGLCFLASIMPIIYYAIGRCMPLNHKWVEANCGYPQTCSKCGLTKGDVTGEEHQWKDANCKNPKTCSVCNMTEGKSLGHNWMEPTCTEGKKCNRCGEYLSSSVGNGHKTTDWTIDKYATCAEFGEKHATCSVCGENVTESIPKKEHELVAYSTKLSSTSTYTAIETICCNNCDYSTENRYEVSGDVRKRLYKDACYSPSYEAIARNPSSYTGDLGVFSGYVIQVSGSTLRVNVPSGYGVETMLITGAYSYDNGGRILEDDIITIYGELTGVTSYETVLGSTLTIPSMEAEYIERVYY